MIALKDFTGEYPRTIPTLLPNNAAQAATDCDFTEGALVGLRTRLNQGGTFRTGIKAMFIYDGVAQNLYSWTRDVDAVRGPMVNDAYGRFYWTDGSSFNVSVDQTGGGGGSGSEPSVTFKVGVPTPTAAMTLTGVNSFSIPGVASIAFSAGVEGSDGGYTASYPLLDSDMTPSGARVSISTLTALRKSWNVSINEAPFTSPVVVTTTPGPTSIDPQTGLTVVGTPTITTTGGTTVTNQAVLKMSLRDAGGVELGVAVFRTGGAHTIPAQMAGIGGSLQNTASGLVLNLTAASAYLEARAYTYTYVNAWGEESGPAPAFSLDVNDGQTVNFSVPNPTASGYKSISFIRIYRTATGTSTNYLFAAQVTIGSGSATTFTDTVLTEALQEPLATLDYEAPPQTMQGLCAMNNGILVGFNGNELYFMEPYLPYAYKPYTIKPLPYRIVGICPTEGGLYVTTTAHPYLITGVNPDSMTDSKVQSTHAGVSKWSICNLGPQVVYATHEGLMMLQGVGASLATSFTFFTRNAWRDRYGSRLANMHINVHDGNIIVWFDDGTPGFSVRFEESNLSLTKLSDVIDAAFRYPVGDGLYVANGGAVYAYNGGNSTKAFSWQSKDFVMMTPTNFGVLQLVGTGAVTYELFADGVSTGVHSATLTGNDTDIFRPPSGFKARRQSLKITGAAGATVKEAYLAVSMEELRNG